MSVMDFAIKRGHLPVITYLYDKVSSSPSSSSSSGSSSSSSNNSSRRRHASWVRVYSVAKLII